METTQTTRDCNLMIHNQQERKLSLDSTQICVTAPGDLVLEKKHPTDFQLRPQWQKIYSMYKTTNKQVTNLLHHLLKQHLLLTLFHVENILHVTV